MLRAVAPSRGTAFTADSGACALFAGTTQITLPGSHVTPCGGDLGSQWQSGTNLTPADVLALGVRTFTQTNVRRLADRVIDWLNFQSVTERGGR